MITPSYALTATERVLPKLALDFTTASLDARITFTRSGNTATVVNSSGYVTSINANLPRFDFNPTTLACRGLLIEEARTNICLQSEDFSTSWTTISASVSTNATTAPSNEVTADKLIPDNTVALNSAAVTQTITAAATTYTFSTYAKKEEFNRVLLQVRDNASAANSASVTVSLVDGTIVTAAAVTGTFTGASVAVAAASNGFYRIALTFTSTGAVALRTRIFANDSVTTTGDGSSGIYIWGAQLEAGAFATSYIPTTTASLTRNADVATMTGTDFSDWFNATEGSFNAAVIPRAVDLTNGNTILSVNDNTNFNRYYAYVAAVTSVPNLQIRAASTVYMQSTSGTASANTLLSTCFAYKANNSAFSASGISANVDTSVTLPTVTQFQIGAHTTAVYLNGWVQKINYWPQRLTNNEVQAFSKG